MSDAKSLSQSLSLSFSLVGRALLLPGTFVSSKQRFF